MAVNSRRIRLVIVIILSVILVGGALSWFVLVPRVIESQARTAFERLSEKTGRKIEFSGVQLRSYKHAVLERLTVSDVDHPERTGVSVGDIHVKLSGIPIGDFSIASVDIESLEVSVRRDHEQTNFDDIIEKLKKQGQKLEGEASEARAWKKYITPFPRIHVSDIAVNMPSYSASDFLEVSAVSANNLEVSQSEETGRYNFDVDLSTLLIESGVRTSYVMHLSGDLKDRNDGVVSLTVPKSSTGEVPKLLSDASISFADASFVLPSTLVMKGLKVAPEEKSLIYVDTVRARLMSMPPKKVSGAYFKEVELIEPVIHDYRSKEGSAIISWGKFVREYVYKLQGEEAPSLTDAAKQVAADAAVAAAQAAIVANAAGSDNVAGEVAEAVVESVIPSINIRDYFFSQRVFITDGSVIVDDLEKGISSFSVSDIDLELGYRSIRRVLDYQLGLEVNDPVSTRVELSGQYDLPGENLKGKLVIHPMRAASGFKALQTGIVEQGVKAPEGMPRWAKLIPALELGDTIFDTELEYAYRQSTERLDITANSNLSHLGWRLDAVSSEPTILSGSLGLNVVVDFAKKAFEINDVHVTTEGADVNLGLKLERRERTLPKGKTRTWLSDLYFSVNTDIPEQSMQVLFEAIPHALRTELDGLTWRGKLGLHFEASGWLDTLSETQHKFAIIPSPDFEITKWPSGRNLMSLNTGFRYTVQDPNALTQHTITIPPSIYPIYRGEFPIYNPRQSAESIRSNYPDWVIFDDLNPWLIQLITTTEDGSFFSHEGFSAMQVKAALERNVNRQAFSRGASTISMQLVKNLFFDRTKTISRKFQEVLYTWLMESVLKIPKARIMELYFNIIEFGPEIYGIEEAAKYYFGKRSRDLSLKESAFLMAIVPSPRKGANHRLKPTLDGWLQKTMNFYIQEMYRRKCDPTTLARNRERAAKQGKRMIYEPCCPPRDSLQLMLEADTMAFYIPDPANPSKYGYRPDLYTAGGTPLKPQRTTSCGNHAEDMNEVEETESIFVPFTP